MTMERQTSNIVKASCPDNLKGNCPRPPNSNQSLIGLARAPDLICNLFVMIKVSIIHWGPVRAYKFKIRMFKGNIPPSFA